MWTDLALLCKFLYFSGIFNLFCAVNVAVNVAADTKSSIDSQFTGQHCPLAILGDFEHFDAAQRNSAVTRSDLPGFRIQQRLCVCLHNHPFCQRSHDTMISTVTVGLMQLKIKFQTWLTKWRSSKRSLPLPAMKENDMNIWSSLSSSFSLSSSPLSFSSFTLS